MVRRFRSILVVSVATLAACRRAAPPSAIEPALAARVPTNTMALAGVDLDRLRASPLAGKLPPAGQAFLAPFAPAHRVLIASTGAQMLILSRGTVPGATQVTPEVALSGAPDLIAAATRPHPPAAILGAAEAAAGASPIWIVLRGGIRLPLNGNLENINNLLRDAESATVTLDPGDPARLELAAVCLTPAAALHLEQSLRALVSLGAVTTRDRALADLLQSTSIRREDRVVRASLSGPLDGLVRLCF